MASENLTQMLARNPLAGSALAQGDGFRALDVSGTGLGKDAVITALELANALSTGAAASNSSGNTTVTPGVVALQHTAIITFSGSGSTTRIVILATSGSPAAYSRCLVRCVLPATAEITVEFRNATSGGTLITSLLTDGSGDDAVAEFYYDGSAWQFLRFTTPANA